MRQANIDITKPFDFSKEKKWECYSPWARLSILSNGSILPCCSFFGINIPVGNIRDMTIEEAWNSQRLQEIRDGVANDSDANCSICMRCGE